MRTLSGKEVWSGSWIWRSCSTDQIKRGTTTHAISECSGAPLSYCEARSGYYVLIQFSPFDDEISLVVKDDRRGLDVASRKMDGGPGQGSLNIRVNLYKGFLDIDSKPEVSTTVTANFKLWRCILL
jgi:signal transduction histidine kinase